MQFLPATFAEWATLAPGRPAGAVPDPQNAWDAIYTAARMLCGGHPSIGDLRAALFGYNPSVAYVDAVLSKATSYSAFDASAGDAVAAPPDETLTAGDAATVVSAALSQVGVPYVWGGATPGVGLDCSGLVVVAYHAAGITLPRTTFEQARVGITVPVAQLAPADLLFFRGGDPADDLGHVALYLGGGAMVDAPHTGAAVRVEAVPYGEVQLVRRVIADP
jgi:cell wall-associated NlpC family hydrolase